MKFENKEEYVAWVKNWKIEHEKLVEIQKLRKYTRKTVNYKNDRWYSDEQIEYILSLFKNNSWFSTQISKALKERLNGNEYIVYLHENLRGRLHDMYTDRINGKKFYHEYLKEEVAA